MFGLFKPVKAAQPARIGLALLLAWLPASHAALTISTTRVVYEGDKRSTSLIVSNPSNNLFAVQTWVNTAADDLTTPVPFLPTPDLFRLAPGEEQQVQINRLPNTLPLDRESLFYFNVQEIPQATDVEGNVLHIALRTRIKLFYRPAQLKDNPVTRLKDLHWSIERRGGRVHLRAHNPTPFHVSFAHIEVNGQGKQERLDNPEMLAPLGSLDFPLSKTAPGPGLKVTYSAINDYGGLTMPLSAEVKVTP